MSGSVAKSSIYNIMAGKWRPLFSIHHVISFQHIEASQGPRATVVQKRFQIISKILCPKDGMSLIPEENKCIMKDNKKHLICTLREHFIRDSSHIQQNSSCSKALIGSREPYYINAL